MPENGEVLRPVTLADAGLVLIHDHVEGPMETILDAPVGWDDAGGFGGWERLAEQIVAILFGSLTVDLADRRDLGEGGQPRPVMGFLEPCDVAADPGLAHFDPPVAAVNVNMTVMCGWPLRCKDNLT